MSDRVHKSMVVSSWHGDRIFDRCRGLGLATLGLSEMGAITTILLGADGGQHRDRVTADRDAHLRSLLKPFVGKGLVRQEHRNNSRRIGCLQHLAGAQCETAAAMKPITNKTPTEFFAVRTIQNLEIEK